MFQFLIHADDDIKAEIGKISDERLGELQSAIDELVYEATMDIRVAILDYIREEYGNKLGNDAEDESSIDEEIDQQIRDNIHI